MTRLCGSCLFLASAAVAAADDRGSVVPHSGLGPNLDRIDKPPRRDKDRLNAEIKAQPRSASLFKERGDYYNAYWESELAVADYNQAIKLAPK